jgi:hypothetical protein
MIRRRIGDSSRPTGSRLYALVEREQLLNIRFFLPATVVFNLLAVLALKAWPAALIERGGHVIIALVQLAAATGYLLYGISFFSRVIPFIAKTRQEWSEDALP